MVEITELEARKLEEEGDVDAELLVLLSRLIEVWGKKRAAPAVPATARTAIKSTIAIVLDLTIAARLPPLEILK